MDNMWILAQADSRAGPVADRLGAGETRRRIDDAPRRAAPTRGPTGRPADEVARSPYSSLLLMVAIMVVVMYMLLFRGPRKQQQQQKQMVQSLKKNDRVRTIGGIYGTVMDVKGDEVVLKMDEANEHQDSHQHVGHRQEPLARGRQRIRQLHRVFSCRLTVG